MSNANELLRDPESNPDFKDTKEADLGLKPSFSQASVASVGREHLSSTLPPHESYEGRHRWDPQATWTPEEEARVVRKTDLKLLTWVCFMVR
jgi:hypothetical protein